MSISLESIRQNRRLMAFTAAAMYGGAAFAGLVETFIPGGPSFSLVPPLAALVLVLVVLAVGPHVPRRALVVLGPIGVGLIAFSVSGTHGATDGAVLYMWPVLWMAFFFGRRGAIGIVACIGVAHAAALLALGGDSGYFDRWVDVMVSVTVVAGVVQLLADRNDLLLAKLAGEARTDKLTGLLNRRGFDERAGLELVHAKRDGSSIAVAAFDIDYFKRINDEWGHETGDRVLAALGAILTDHSREIDVVGRIGGEEFAILLPGATSTDADALSERVRAALSDLDIADLPTVRVSAGIASAVAPPSVEGLLQAADSALYAAKRAGRNRTVIAPRQGARVTTGW